MSNVIQLIADFEEAAKAIEVHFTGKVQRLHGSIKRGKSKPEAAKYLNNEIDLVNRCLEISRELMAAKVRTEQEIEGSDWALIAIVQARIQAIEKDKQTAYNDGYLKGLEAITGGECRNTIEKGFSRFPKDKEAVRSQTIENARANFNF